MEAEQSSNNSDSSSRRRLVGLVLAGGLTLLAGAEPAVAKAKGRKQRKAKSEGKRTQRASAKRKPKFKSISRTFTNASPIMIPEVGAANPYPSEIIVSGFNQGKLLDANVVLRDFSHALPIDVDVQVESPNGRRAVIMSDTGYQYSVTNLTLRLDDQAAAFLPVASQLGSGSFRPTNGLNAGVEDFPAPATPSANVALATFNGTNPNGTWKLYVRDQFALFDGSVTGGWSLIIKARVRVK